MQACNRCDQNAGFGEGQEHRDPRTNSYLWLCNTCYTELVKERVTELFEELSQMNPNELDDFSFRISAAMKATWQLLKDQLPDVELEDLG